MADDLNAITERMRQTIDTYVTGCLADDRALDLALKAQAIAREYAAGVLREVAAEIGSKHTPGWTSVSAEVHRPDSPEVCSWCERPWPCEPTEFRNLLTARADKEAQNG